jgi:hypothetical protein
MAQLPRDRKTKLPQQRRFPPPWTVEEYNDTCFVVRDGNGQQLAYIYFEINRAGRASRIVLPLVAVGPCSRCSSSQTID